jgi:hypothetical protein
VTVQGTVEIKKAHVVADSGDGYVQVVHWDADGQVHSLAVQPYGVSNFVKYEPSPHTPHTARTTRVRLTVCRSPPPRSLHFKDQAPLFVEQRLREVWMEERLIDGPRLEEAYRPGREDELGKRALGLLGEIGARKRREARASANAVAAAAEARGQSDPSASESQPAKRKRSRLPAH